MTTILHFEIKNVLYNILYLIPGSHGDLDGQQGGGHANDGSRLSTASDSDTAITYKFIRDSFFLHVRDRKRNFSNTHQS
jgi:hypothetical protein